MHQQHDRAAERYPQGRGYGNDYMRGGEVLGGYGYSERQEYSQPRGELAAEGPPGYGDGQPEGDAESRR
jgi:hypothetical protein